MYFESRVLDLVTSEIVRLADVPASFEAIHRFGRAARLADLCRDDFAARTLMSLADIGQSWGTGVASIVDIDRVASQLDDLAGRTKGGDRHLTELIIARDDAESLLAFLRLTAEADDQTGLATLLAFVDRAMEDRLPSFDPWALPPSAVPVPDIVVAIAIGPLHGREEDWWSRAVVPLALQPTGREHRTIHDKWFGWLLASRLTPSARRRVPRAIQRRLDRLYAFAP